MGFVFESFWHFAGTFLIILLIINGIVDIIKALRGDKNND